MSFSSYYVERTFGSIKKWFGGDKACYVGLDKTHTQHSLQAIAYNLKRALGYNCVQFAQKRLKRR